MTILPPLERWLARAFGDVEGTHFGSGWISGTASVFLGALALLYPIPLLRALVNVTIGLAFLLGQPEEDLKGGDSHLISPESTAALLGRPVAR